MEDLHEPQHGRHLLLSSSAWIHKANSLNEFMQAPMLQRNLPYCKPAVRVKSHARSDLQNELFDSCCTAIFALEPKTTSFGQQLNVAFLLHVNAYDRLATMCLHPRVFVIMSFE